MFNEFDIRVPVSLFLATLSSVSVLCRSSPLLLESDNCSSSFFIWLSEEVCSTTETQVLLQPDVNDLLEI